MVDEEIPKDEQRAPRPQLTHPIEVDMLPTPPVEHRGPVLEERRRTSKAMAKMAIEFKDLYEKAYTDDLTGVGNRRLFYERVPALLAYAQKHNIPTVVVLGDVRGLKRTNDSKEAGHDKGNDLLRAAATSIKDLVRDDDIVARLGGDEFGGVLFDYKPPQGMTPEAHDAQTVERISGSFEDQAHKNGIPADLHVGLDVVLVRIEPDSQIDSVLQQADAAMSALKEQRYADLAAQGVVYADSRLQA